MLSKELVMKKIIFVALVMFVAIGCSSGPYRAKSPKKDKELYEQTQNFVVLDKALQKKIAVADQSPSRTEDGRLKVRAKILNKTKKDLSIQVQTIYKDEEGYPVDETNWQLEIIPAKAYYYYESKSLNNKATDYTIRCKTAQ